METIAPQPAVSQALPSPEPSPDDTIARRIVMPRRVWDQLVRMAEALEVTQGIEVQPADVALIALEAGLSQIQRRSSGEPEAAQRTSSGRAKRAKGSSGSTTRKRRRGAAVRLDAQDRGELEAMLAGARSVRARQRVIALWLGLRRRKVNVEALRHLATQYDAYCVANFAQNMKKDAAYFSEVRGEDGRRAGWRLTRTGQIEAKARAEAALAPA